MKDKLNITIRIADQDPIPLSIERNDEATVRKAVDNVNKLWQSWMQRYRDVSSSRVMAMVAFQFARLLESSGKANEEALAALNDFETKLDNMLLSTGANSEE